MYNELIFTYKVNKKQIKVQQSPIPVVKCLLFKLINRSGGDERVSMEQLVLLKT